MLESNMEYISCPKSKRALRCALLVLWNIHNNGKNWTRFPLKIFLGNRKRAHMKDQNQVDNQEPTEKLVQFFFLATKSNSQQSPVNNQFKKTH